MLFHIHSVFDDVSFLSGSHTSAATGKNFPKQLIMPKNDWGSFLLVGGAISVSACSFLGLVVLPFLEIFPLKRYSGAQETTLFY